MSVHITLTEDETAWAEGDIEVGAALAYVKAQQLKTVKDLAPNIKIQVFEDSYAKLKYRAKYDNPLTYRILILAVYGQYQIIGYMLGKDCIQDRWYNKADQCHYVPQQELVQITTCPCEIPFVEANDIVF
jgi:hypothetical protein